MGHWFFGDCLLTGLFGWALILSNLLTAFVVDSSDFITARRLSPSSPSGWRRTGRWAVVLVGVGGLVGWGWGAKLPNRWWVLRGNGDHTLVVKRGGIYTGSYRCSDSGVPCIRIATTEPVTLRSCILVGAGDLIHASVPGARLTVVDCQGYGLLPSRDQTRRGRFVEANSPCSVRIEHNYFAQTTGISIYQWSGDGSLGQTLTVRYNRCRNIDGRFRDGGEEFANFLGLNGLPSTAHIEVAWNEVINEPDKSLVADNINFFNSGGTLHSPARLHDNYIQGAYPYPATGRTYAGSGITLDGKARAALMATAYVDCYGNQLVSTCAALNIAAGHDNHFHDNRVVTSGLLPDGSKLTANYAAAGIWNAYKQPPTTFYNNRISHNTIGFVHWGGSSPLPNRQDLSPGACKACTTTMHLPNPITLQTEQAEWVRWQQKLRRQGVRIGPRSGVVARPPAVNQVP